MAARKPIVCGISAGGIIPPLPQVEVEVEVVEVSSEEEEDIVEISREEYMDNMGYFTRVEEEEDDIEPEFRRMLERMQAEEKKLSEERFNRLKSGIKVEEGQSSKGDGSKRKRRM